VLLPAHGPHGRDARITGPYDGSRQERWPSWPWSIGGRGGGTTIDWGVWTVLTFAIIIPILVVIMIAFGWIVGRHDHI
jgi:hypothetical protein